MTFRAIGSSYLIRQVAGSEKVGGLRVTVYPRSDGLGQLTIEWTDWLSGQQLESPLNQVAETAAAAIRESTALLIGAGAGCSGDS